MFRRITLLLVGLTTIGAVSAALRAESFQADLDALLNGVSVIAAPGTPGALCVFGDNAFVVAAADNGQGVQEPVVAAGRLGRGRVVAFGHDGYLIAGEVATGQTARLLANAIRWASGDAVKKNSGIQVALDRMSDLSGLLEKESPSFRISKPSGWGEGLDKFDVLCIDVRSLKGTDLPAVRKFLANGGGAVIAGTGWGWLHSNRRKDLRTDNTGNNLLAQAGIVWANAALSSPGKAGYPITNPPPPLTHASTALNALAAGLESPEASRGKSRSKHQKIKELQQATETVFRAVDSVPPQDGLFLPQLEALRNKYGPQAFPTAKRPLGAAQGLQRVLLTVELREMRNLPAEKLKAHPAATAFPGAAPAEALRVTRKVQIDTGVPEWHSTGLYAAPGEVIEVVVPKAAAGRKLAVRIGAHKDSLWHLDSWKRCPEVIRKYAMEEPLTRAANAFGGLVYVEVPKGCDLGKIEVEIRNVVEAPHYVLGRTDLAAWRETIRNLPAPWAELETSKVILTVPSEVVRKLEDPEDLMKFWDTVMDCCAELVGKPLDRSHPQRYVSDVQISAGYMHSGYPIMTWLDAAPVMVDKTRLKGDGHGGVWGLWHEMGHNHQSRDWTFDGTGEVTCNLFTLYVMEKACGKAVKDQDRFSPAAWDKRMRSYFTGDRPDFRKWKNDPFLALQMYIQMQQAFGWEAFKTVFAEYRDLPAGQRPRTDDQKRDQWLVRFSKTVGRNLGPFFEAWGVPTSPQARQSVADLPGWMPEGFPPQAAK